ncbi:MerR family DNA-binding transcriptional regulator [Alicyclobacillaceae bacterium I2511]|nr:MerR family DNA-binding transcriptional regulator [Alicyclobacillaceae bacterium I2511]
MIMETEEFLPVGKVAKLLGVTPQTIRRWQKEGRKNLRNTLTYKSTLILGNVHKRSQAFRQKTKQLINEMEGGVTCDNGDENSEDWHS